jgi:hypothetical protein
VAASWDCDDGNAEAWPGAVEVCDGADNNCDGRTDEGTGGSCYDGPAGTAGVGRCREGVRPCVDGQPGSCVGQLLPVPEVCNGEDDDCDGLVDEGADMVELTCGIGACRTSVPYCANGVVQSCTPLAPQTEICDGIDNDCDGVVDEGCGCIHVAPGGTSGSSGGPGDPLGSINEAIALAVADSSRPQRVCVAAATGCAPALYDEQVQMADGVQVLGQFVRGPGTWTRNPSCVTEIQAPAWPAVYFPPDVSQPTALDGFVVSFQNTASATQTAAVVIEGSEGAIVGHSEIYGASSGDLTMGIDVLPDPGTGAPATPVIHRSLVEGGDGALLSVGIYSEGSAPSIQDICDPANVNATGRCVAGCGTGLHIRGHHTGWPDSAVGIWLHDSPGARVDRAAVCTRARDAGSAIQITGDAAGTVIARSNLGAWGAETVAVGVSVGSCAGASPWIGDNHLIWGEGSLQSASTSIGVSAVGDCAPVIEGNRLITGGIEISSSVTRGILCGQDPDTGQPSPCLVVGNEEILGSSQGAPANSVGVLCEPGACAVIRRNQRISGRGGADIAGVALLGPAQTLVAANRIEGGCPTSNAVGLLTEGALARIQNNVLHGGSCTAGVSSDAGLFVGAMLLADATLHEVDLHSNAITGGGNNPSQCVSVGIVIDQRPDAAAPLGPRGLLRNNVVDHGVCPTGAVVREGTVETDPRIFEHNALVPASHGGVPLYLDEGQTVLSTAAAVNALSDITASGNLDTAARPSFGTQGFPGLGAGSPLRNAGTCAGAPATDWEGDPRPQEGSCDIGPDEYEP